MQSPGSARPSSRATSQVLIGSIIGGLTLLALFIFAILQASHEESALGWIIVGIIVAWLGLACYMALLVTRQAKATQKSYEQAATYPQRDHRILDDKLEHSFHIILVQSKVISEQRATPGDDSEDMINRALDTIDTTARNGMGMLKDAKGEN